VPWVDLPLAKGYRTKKTDAQTPRALKPPAVSATHIRAARANGARRSAPALGGDDAIDFSDFNDHHAPIAVWVIMSMNDSNPAPTASRTSYRSMINLQMMIWMNE
jgi:hypothetical protein